jgi:hypothetical protein
MALANSVRAVPPFSNAVSTGDEGGGNYATASVDVNRPGSCPLAQSLQSTMRTSIRTDFGNAGDIGDLASGAPHFGDRAAAGWHWCSVGSSGRQASSSADGDGRMLRRGRSRWSGEGRLWDRGRSRARSCRRSDAGLAAGRAGRDAGALAGESIADLARRVRRRSRDDDLRRPRPASCRLRTRGNQRSRSGTWRVEHAVAAKVPEGALGRAIPDLVAERTSSAGRQAAGGVALGGRRHVSVIFTRI